jgi:hypothetical protein
MALYSVSVCKGEVLGLERARCWISASEYYKLESHKRCEYMYPIGVKTNDIEMKDTRIYCNIKFYKRTK